MYTYTYMYRENLIDGGRIGNLKLIFGRGAKTFIIIIFFFGGGGGGGEFE